MNLVEQHGTTIVSSLWLAIRALKSFRGLIVIQIYGSIKQMTQATESQRGILLSEAALQQVKLLQEKQGKELCLRVGVRQGGCSGMSYMMDFEDHSKISDNDDIFDYDGFKIVCDRKSLLDRKSVV